MMSRNNFTLKIVICSAIALSLFPSYPANAADFKIGNVKQTFPTDSLCVSFNPKMPDKAILVEVGSAWININGKDIELKSLSYKKIGRKQSVSKFQGKGFTVNIERTLIRVNQGALETIDHQEVITIKRGNQSKVLKVNGYCS
jgi:hypothetical protein